MKKIFFLSLTFLLIVALDVNAYNGKRYWISTTTSNFNTTANWSLTNGGAGGAAVPGSSDTIYFTSTKTGQCTLDVNINVKRWEMGASCGTFSQGTYSITVGTSGAVLSGGTFAGGSGAITFSGACTISGTAFTSSSAAFSTNSNFTYSSGSFAHNGGTMKFTASCTITASATLTMDTLEFFPSAHSGYTIAGAGTMNVVTLLRDTGSNQIAINTGTINVQGNIRLSNTFSGTSAGGTGTIVMNGTGSQYIYGNSTKGNSRLPQLTINKSGTLYLVGVISMQGTNFTYTAGTIDEGSSTIYFAGNKTFSGAAGAIPLNNITFGGSTAWTYTVSTINAKGYLEIVGSANVIINTGTINVRGNVIITNAGAGGGGTATVVLDGTGSQAITGSGTAGQGRLPNLTVNKGAGTLTLASIISVDGNWIHAAGAVSSSGSTVAFYGNFNLNGTGSSTMAFNRIQISGGTRTITGNVDANENFVIASGTTCVAGSYTINVGGNWDNQGGTFTCNTSTVVFDGSGYKEVKRSSGSETFYNLTIDKSGSAIKASIPVIVNNVLSITNGRLRTNATNYVSLIAGASISGGSNTAYVDGPIRKTGNTAFTFPVGDSAAASAAYHPLYMTAPSSASDQFQAQYFASAQAYGSTKASTLQNVSTCQYWTFNRLAGTSTPTVSLTWNSNCDNNSFSEMRVALWNGTQWNDLGQASSTPANAQSGTVAASSATSFTVNPAPITIAYTTVTKSYAPVSQTPDGGFVYTDGNILYFQYEEEYKDANGLLNFQIINVSNNTAVTLYGFPSAVNVPVKYGTNLFKMDLYTAVNTPLSAGMYMLIVTNDKNESWQLMFNKN